MPSQMVAAAALCCTALAFAPRPALAQVAGHLESRLYDGADGVNCEYFNVGGRIPWRHKLGDWLDAAGVRQGDLPIATASVNAADAIRTIQWDLTSLAKPVGDRRRWNGGLLLAPVKGAVGGTARFFSREASDGQMRPRLRIDYTSGATEIIHPVADASLDCTTVASLGDREDLGVGDQKRTVLQFDVGKRDDLGIARSTLELTTTSGRRDLATIGVFLLDLPVTSSERLAAPGIAARYPRDAGIDKDPDVIFATGFESTFWRSEWSYISIGSHADRIERDDERRFDPLIGHALRVEIPRSGNLGLDMGFNFRDKIGDEPDEIYFRYYVRFANDWIPSVDGGKLPGPAGTYGRSGWGGRKASGNEGWSMRGLFHRSPTPGNPLHGRVLIGTYAYHAEGEDFWGDHWNWNLNGNPSLERNRWYCIEQHFKVNALGVKDGVLRAWIDRAPAFEKRDIHVRDAPNIRIEKIWMNVYHGGTARAAETLHLYFDNVVIARKPVGCLAP